MTSDTKGRTPWGRRALLTACLVLPCACAADAEMGPAIPDHKKLIAFATNSHAASPAYLRQHIVEMEKRLPLDGLIVFVYHNSWEMDAREGKRARGSGIKNGQECMLFGGRKFTRDEFSKDLEDLKATAFTTFTDNFILLTTSELGSQWTGTKEHRNLDWFDPNWSTIAQNGAVAAWVAREAGFKGIFIDAEQYQGSQGPWKRPFDYRSRPDTDTRTLAEVSSQARKRGREWMQAATAAYPEITIILYPHTGWKRTLDYELLGPFADGLLEGLGPKATLVDSGQAYQYQTYQEFVDLKDEARKQGLENTQVPHLYPKVQQGLGLWVDYECRVGGEYAGWRLDPKEFHKNYRPPDELGNTLHNALTVADRYVWLFVWHGDAWWAPGERTIKSCPLCPHPEGPFPHAYAEAFANCRKPHPLDWRPARRKRVYSSEDLIVMGENLLANGDMETWLLPAQSPLGWRLGGQGPKVARDDTTVKDGTCSARLTTVLARGHVFLDQRVDADAYEGKTITFGAWLRDEHDLGHVQILDFVGDNHESSVVSSEWTDDSGWRFLTATKTIRKGTRTIVFRLGANTIKDHSVLFDGSQAVVMD